MDIAFLVIFLVGLGLAVLTFVLGELFEFGGDVAGELGEVATEIAGVDADVDAGVDLGGADINTPSPFSSRVIFSGLTAFGGFGFIGSALDWPMAVTLLFAIGGFVGVSAGMFFGVVVPLSRQQGSIRELRREYLDVEASVTSEVPAEGVGLVTLESPSSGSLVTESASSSTGERIKQGTAVKIVRVTASTIVVAPLE